MSRREVSEVQHCRGVLANASRRGGKADIAEARRNLATANIAQYIERVLEDAPRLTIEQRERLISLIRGS